MHLKEKQIKLMPNIISTSEDTRFLKNEFLHKVIEDFTKPLLSVLLYDKDGAQVLSQQIENLRIRSPRWPTPVTQAAASQLRQNGLCTDGWAVGSAVCIISLNDLLAKGLNLSRLSFLSSASGKHMSPQRLLYTAEGRGSMCGN